jgi:hypothetical protein
MQTYNQKKVKNVENIAYFMNSGMKGVPERPIRPICTNVLDLAKKLVGNVRL